MNKTEGGRRQAADVGQRAAGRKKKAMRKSMLVVLPIILGTSLFPTAAAADNGPEVLTLDKCLSITLEKNRDIQKAQEYQNWIQGRYLEERAQALPQVRLGGSFQRQSDDTYYQYTGGLFPKEQDITSYEVSLNQAIFTWGKIPASIRAAKLGLASGGEQLRLARQGALKDVTAAFYNVLLAQEMLDIARKNLILRERHLEDAKKRFELGTATDYDVLAAEVDVENIRPLVIRQENAVRTAKKRLLFHLGREEAEIEVQGTLEAAPITLPAYNDAVALAMAHRPELTNQRLLVQGYEQLIRIAKTDLRPRLDLVGSYAKRNLASGNMDIDATAWSAAMVLAFPVFDGFRTQGKVMQARSNYETAKLDEAKLRDQVTLEVREALDAAREAQLILEALKGTVAQADRLLQMAEQGLEFGVKTRLDVDDARVNLTQARANQATAQHDYLVALTHLDWVMGALGE
jgi:HAE1 family hydrophobic/amphiphilic exporter-1